MTDREKAIDKLRKLQAMADSAKEIGNEEEAQAFAAKVQAMLTAYKLSQADLRPEEKKDEPIDGAQVYWQQLGFKTRKVRVGWTERLAAMVCEAYYCDFIVAGTAKYGQIGFFIGTETDRRIALYMYVTLARFLYKLAEREDRKFRYQAWVAAGKPDTGAIPESAHGFKSGFMYGFITRLKERFDEEVRPKADAAAQATTYAIVAVRKDAKARVDAWVDENMNTKKIRGTTMDPSNNRAGRAAGRDAADSIELKPKALENTGVKPKELSRG